MQYWNGAWVGALGGGRMSVLGLNVGYKKFLNGQENDKWGFR
ncbi:hypothetical protein [Gehongia tenuis]|nr:hypothetical protein [Gehongia tenuis]